MFRPKYGIKSNICIAFIILCTFEFLVIILLAHHLFSKTLSRRKLQMDKILIHAKSNELKMREGFQHVFNGELTLHFKSVQFKQRCSSLIIKELKRCFPILTGH